MNYTSINQSKKLLELGLNPESADMYWAVDANIVIATPYITKTDYETQIPAYKGAIPCWSVGALLELVLTIKSSKSFHLSIEDGVYCMCYNDSSNEDYEEFVGSTPLEAVYHTVYWLLENGYIKKGELKMKRIEEFEQRLDALLKEFSDLSHEELADSLEYYSSQMQVKADRSKEE